MGDVYKIVGGTGFAQVLIALSTPILSRIYTEPTFGLSTIFISLSLILGVIASLRYEVAILLPKDENDAIQLLRISLISTGIITVLSAFGIWILQDPLINWLGESELRPYLALLPVALAVIGIYQTLNSWNTRTKNFWRLSAAKVVSAIVTISVQLGLGFWLRDHPAGLIFGFVAGYLAGSLFLGIYIYVIDMQVRGDWDWCSLKANLARYRKFPIIDTWATLINAVSWQIPPLLLTNYFSTAQAGSYAMAYRLVQLPVSFIGVAFSQVFSQRAASVKDDTDALIDVTRRVLHRLIGFSLYPSFLLTVLGRDLFVVFLGPNWDTAGIYVQILGIWMFFWFSSWPLGMLANLKDKQDIILVLQTCLLITRIAALVVGGLLDNDYLAIALFSATGIIVYIAYALVCLHLIQYPLQATLRFLTRHTLAAAGVASALGLLRVSLDISPPGMVLLGAVVSGVYFLMVMRKSLL